PSFCNPHILALAYEIGRQAQRQFPGQPERAQLKGRSHVLAWKAAREECKEVALLAERALKRRQKQPRLRDRRLLRDHVGERYLPGFISAAATCTSSRPVFPCFSVISGVQSLTSILDVTAPIGRNGDETPP